MMKLQSKQTIQSVIAVLLVSLFVGSAQAIQDKPDAAAKTPEQIEADKLNALVIQFFKEKRFKEALVPAKQAVEIREKALGPEHALTLVSLKNLAAVYGELNKHSDAAGIRQRVLKIEEKLYGTSSIRLSDNLSKLGWERAREQNYGAAIELFKRNLQIREAAYGADHKELVPALNDLAMSSQRDGKLAQSIGYFKQMIAIQEKQLGENHIDVAELLSKCAIILKQANKKAEAEDYDARARAIYLSQTNAPDSEAVNLAPHILQGAAILKVQPGYPNGAKQARVQGSVLVQVVIDEAGIVTKATAIQGPGELRPASEESARRWRFKPTIVNGRPIKVQGILTFNFVLR
jgi:TonB family protein